MAIVSLLWRGPLGGRAARITTLRSLKRLRGPGRGSLGGPEAKSLWKKCRESLPAPKPQKSKRKSRKRSEKSPRTHFQTFFGLFGPFSRLFGGPETPTRVGAWNRYDLANWRSYSWTERFFEPKMLVFGHSALRFQRETGKLALWPGNHAYFYVFRGIRQIGLSC